MTITATPSTAAPTPHVDIVVTGLPADAATITITSNAAGEVATVRGASRKSLGGSTLFAITDYATPFGVAVTYTASAYGISGELLATEQVTTEPLDIAVAWISDPLSPGISAAVPEFGPVPFDGAYERDGGPVGIRGSSLPVAVTGVRQEVSGLPLTMRATEALQSMAIRTVLMSADPFLLRIPPKWKLPLPGAAYFTSPQIREQTRGTVTAFFMSATRVAPQIAEVIVPVRTYQTVLDESGTYATLLAIRPTYLNVLTGV